MDPSNQAPEHLVRGDGKRRMAPGWPLLVGRLLLLVLAALAVAAAFALGRSEGGVPGGRARYICPMHAEVTATAPGECPICHMALEEISARRLDTSSKGGSMADDPGGDGTSPAGPVWLPGSTASARRYDVVDIVKRRVFSRELRAPAWVEGDGFVWAILYRDEVSTLAAGEHGSFFLAASPAVSFDASFVAEPAVPWDHETARVRFRVEPGARTLRSGETGWVKLAAKPRAALVVPYAAVVQSNEGPYVLASSDGRTFSRRSVELGKVFYGLAVILSGVKNQERIAVRSTFFMDAERRLHTEPQAASEAVR